MEKLLVFGVISFAVIVLSRKTLFNIHSHGFYRFMSWECIAWLLASNYRSWFDDPFCFRQVCSWLFLFASAYLVVAGAFLLKTIGKPTATRDEANLYAFEKTTTLVDSGIFHYIRHPLYSSLLFLTWGILLKNPTGMLIVVAAFSSVFLYLTAIFDEKECIRFFGEKYREYMKRTRRFIPFLF